MTIDDLGDLVAQRDVHELTSALAARTIRRQDFLVRAAALGLSLTIAETLAAQAAEAAARGRALQTGPAITLNYWRHNYAPEVAVDKSIAKQFMAAHPNIKVNVANQGSTDQEHQKLLVAMAGGSGPDIVLVLNGDFPQFASLGFFQPLTSSLAGAASIDDFKKRWLKGALGGWQYKGQYYGIPAEAASYVMVISPPLFREAGLDPVKDAPKTWEDIARIGPKLTKRQKGAIVQQGFGMPSYPSVMNLVLDSMIHQLGGSIISADGKHATINSAAGVKALQTLVDFANKYKISQLAGKPLQGPGFDTGHTAIIADVGLWYRGYLKTVPKIYQQGKGLKFLPFPRFKGGKNLGALPYGYAWCVSAHSPHAAEAWEFVKFLSGHATAGYVDLGDIPPKASLLTDAKVTANPDTRLALNELATGAPYEAAPEQVDSIVYAAVSSAILDKVPVKHALDQAAQQLDALIPTVPYRLLA